MSERATAIAILAAIPSSLVAVGILIVAVVATGNTFGQRCANAHEHGSAEWSQCVDDLRAGRAALTKGE